MIVDFISFILLCIHFIGLYTSTSEAAAKNCISRLQINLNLSEYFIQISQDPISLFTLKRNDYKNNELIDTLIGKLDYNELKLNMKMTKTHVLSAS